MHTDELLPSWLCLALMRIGTKLASGFDQHFQVMGLTQAQFRMLLTIWEQGGATGITPSELAEHLLIERSSTSALVNVLVGRGWVVREPGENRRSYRLRLTAEGGQVLQTAIPNAVNLADYVLSRLEHEDLLRLRQLLGNVETRLRDYSPPTPIEVKL